MTKGEKLQQYINKEYTDKQIKDMIFEVYLSWRLNPLTDEEFDKIVNDSEIKNKKWDVKILPTIIEDAKEQQVK